MEELSHKELLYYKVIDIKTFLGYRATQFGIDLIDRFMDTNIIVGTIPFKTPGLRGMAFIGDTPSPDSIVLNSQRNELERNFDCGHEVIHLSLHRHLEQKTFNCFDDEVHADQDPFLEWQANEGSAEFLIPHMVFLPLVKIYFGTKPSHDSVENFKRVASKLFGVPPAAIKYRLESLKYEIVQYYAGVDILDIQILSKRQQEKRGIYISSLNRIKSGEYLDMEKYAKMKNRSGGNQNGF